MDYIIADKSHIDDLIDIRIEYFKEVYNQLYEEQISILKIKLYNFLNEHIGKDFFAFIGIENGKIISTVLMSIYDRPANLKCPTGIVAEIVGVYTLNEFRCKGIASNLTQMALKLGETLDVSYVLLESSEDGERLYKGLGFEYSVSDYKKMKYKYSKNVEFINTATK